MTVGGVSVAWWLQFLLVCLVLLGGGLVARWLWQGLCGVREWWPDRPRIRWIRDWWYDFRRDRVAPLFEDDRIIAGKCETCWAENDGEGCDWAMCGCACHDWEELPPERSQEELGFTGEQPATGYLRGYHVEIPLDFLKQETRERRAPKWEAEARGHYVAMGLDYPSGLMARVRSLNVQTTDEGWLARVRELTS